MSNQFPGGFPGGFPNAQRLAAMAGGNQYGQMPPWSQWRPPQLQGMYQPPPAGGAAMAFPGGMPRYAPIAGMPSPPPLSPAFVPSFGLRTGAMAPPMITNRPILNAPIPPAPSAAGVATYPQPAVNAGMPPPPPPPMTAPPPSFGGSSLPTVNPNAQLLGMAPNMSTAPGGLPINGPMGTAPSLAGQLPPAMSMAPGGLPINGPTSAPSLTGRLPTLSDARYKRRVSLKDILGT